LGRPPPGGVSRRLGAISGLVAVFGGQAGAPAIFVLDVLDQYKNGARRGRAQLPVPAPAPLVDDAGRRGRRAQCQRKSIRGV